MAHMTKDLINHIHAALVADSGVTGILPKGAGGVYKGLNLITSDYLGYEKPFINVTFGSTTRQAAMSKKGRYLTEVMVEVVHDEKIEATQTNYFDDIEKVQDVLTDNAQYNPVFSGNKAFMEEDGYEEIPAITDDGLRITTITMTYEYDKIRT